MVCEKFICNQTKIGFASAKEEPSGAKEGASGAKEGAAGAKEEAAGAKEEAAGAKEEAAGARKGAAGAKNLFTPTFQNVLESHLKVIGIGKMKFILTAAFFRN
jgi:hypothetical protein